MTTVVILEPMMKEAQLKDVKATLSAIVDQAIAGDPTVITRHGRKAAVVLSFAEYERLSRIPSFAEMLAAFPGDEDDLPRVAGGFREVEF